jgi:hypothetical protein
MTGNSAEPTARAPGSGAGHDGPAGRNRQWTMADVDALPRTAAGGDTLQEAIDAGLLVDLGYGPTRNRN